MWLLTLALLAGCDGPAEPAPHEQPQPLPMASRFRNKDAGQLQGRVFWAGTVPKYSAISIPVPGPTGGVVYKEIPNPNRQRVDVESGGLSGAVVMLEGVDPAQLESWDLPALRVKIHDEQIVIEIAQFGLFADIRKGAAPIAPEHLHLDAFADGHVGLVQVGQEIEMVSRDPALHVLSARGAAFFGLAFPEPDRPRRRRFDRPGLVELSSGAGKYWHRAYLWVCPHPYFTLSDAEGRFSFGDVPEGEYRLVAWLPNGDLAAIDRDPNTGAILRYHFAPPLTTSRPIRIVAGQTAEVDCWLSK